VEQNMPWEDELTCYDDSHLANKSEAYSLNPVKSGGSRC